ncbi:MAG TPA: hypothetical protein PK016_00690 [Candidatus Atribacteria bacterium]|nr:hypothetical protein [Candidatus Atribacteria bacterium]
MNFNPWVWGMIFSFSVAVVITMFVSSAWRRHRRKKIFSRAQVVEKEAASLLENSGFKLVEEQPEREFFIQVNGKKIPCKARADYLVRRGKDLYVAEVKTGEYLHFDHPRVRRQLLEYYLVYRPKAIILVNGESDELYRVTFPFSNASIWRWMVILSILFFVLGLIIGRWIKF